MKTLCIYHKNCADGFGAAWVVRKALGEENVEFLAANYGNEPPDVTDRDVLIVDFSYKLPVLKLMWEECRTLLILDHHKSAEKELESLTIEGGNTANSHNIWEKVDLQGPRDVVAIFDMERSGAMLTWNFFFPSLNPPRIIEHIQDRDLWRFDLSGTKEIMAYVFTQRYHFGDWNNMIGMSDKNGTEYMCGQGATLLRKQAKDVDALITKAFHMEICGVEVPVVNAPWFFASDIGHKLALDAPFAATYYDDGTKRHFSLRSREDGGMDVSEIARKFGGGGHEHAAGFEVNVGHAPL